MSKQELGLQRECYRIAHTGQEENPTSLELGVRRGGKLYFITVGTPEFLKGLKEYNLGLEDPVKIDENVFVLDTLEHPEDLCNNLAQIPFDELKPFLTEQADE